MPHKTFFLTGTDTGVGKTLASLFLVLSLKKRGFDAGYMKPVETGVKIRKNGARAYIDGSYVKKMGGLGANIGSITPFTFEKPLAPYAASRFEGKKFTIGGIISSFKESSSGYDYMIVEGAGGMLVPFEKGFFAVDIAKKIGAPVILVTRAGLGMINQTLLSIECARSRGIEMGGIIINNALNEKDESINSNKDILSELTDVPIIGNIPHLDKKELKDPKTLEWYALKYVDISRILG